MEAPALPGARGALAPRSRRLLGAFGDERLVDQIRGGNDAAFEVLFDRHHRAILGFCRHMLGSQEEAEDALQQAFAAAYSDLCKDDRDIRLKPWLYTIARNRCLSILRARREQPAELDDQVATAGLAESVQQRADLRELVHDLRRLPDEQREALVLFELGDLSHAEIADVIGVETVKVKALVFQARTTLIEQREARAIPCAEIREELATASGGALRRGPLRRHLKSCPGCRDFRKQVRSQRRALATLLPVIPSAGLKAAALGGAGAAASGAAGGAGFLGTLGATKLAVGAIMAGTAVGGVVVQQAVVHHHHQKPPASSAQATRTPHAKAGVTQSPTKSNAAAPTPPSSAAAVPVSSPTSEQKAKARKAKARKAKRKRARTRHHSHHGTSSASGGGNDGAADSGGSDHAQETSGSGKGAKDDKGGKGDKGEKGAKDDKGGKDSGQGEQVAPDESAGGKDGKGDKGDKGPKDPSDD